MTSLKSFIKAVRAAKTAADERTVIQKESAKIRTSFRDDRTSHATRRSNVAKLLYLFTLGERTHFGQVECLKLLASPHFTDKRLGYLGTMLLLDENQEVLMLITNSLDNDLLHPNQYVVSLALCTLANIASGSMSRDLFPRVEKLITASNPYLKKKAALCALRIIRRVPELEEMFVEHAKALLTESNHGVLLCGASLAIDMIDNNPVLANDFAEILPGLISTLKTLSTTGYSPTFDVQGVPDPFLQTRLIRLLRAMGQDNQPLSEQMTDILAAIASNTDGAKNVGNAVLYEAVLAIFAIEADSGLRVLGINILGTFLSNKDNNTRYVALNTLLKVVGVEPAAVQRHRATIVECFQDPDISIRRRALELSYALINQSNVRVMVRELLTFMEDCDPEFKPQLVSQIALASERFAPNKRWHIDTLMRTFALAGNHTKENVLSAFILLVIDAPDLQLYAAQKLYRQVRADLSQQGLLIVALWVLGEYCDILLQAGSFNDDEGSVEINESLLVELVENILASPFATQVVQEYAINAAVKFSVRMKGAPEFDRIRRLLGPFAHSLDPELQQRAIEYKVLLVQDKLRRGVFERMPAPEFGEDLETQHAKAMSKALVRRRRRPIAPGAKPAVSKAPVSDLLDLGDSATPVAAPSSDLLADIFGSSPAPTAPSLAPAPANPAAKDILDLFGSTPAAPTPAPAASVPPVPSGPPAYSSSHLVLHISGSKESSGVAKLRAVFTATSPVENIVMQVAVPKSQKLALQPLAKPELAAGESAEQLIKITGPEGAALRLRLRISYVAGGQKIQEQVDYNGLPQGLF